MSYDKLRYVKGEEQTTVLYRKILSNEISWNFASTFSYHKHAVNYSFVARRQPRVAPQSVLAVSK